MKEKLLSELITPIVEDLGFSFWGLEYLPQKNGAMLRVFIDGENGIGVNDCAKCSREISGVLEVEDPISSAYTLEVSSPGLYRSLNTVEHFKWAQGTPVMIQLSKTIGDLLPGEDLDKKFSKTKKVVGDLEEVDDEYIVLKLDEEYSLKLQYTDIKRANLEPEIQAKSR